MPDDDDRKRTIDKKNAARRATRLGRARARVMFFRRHRRWLRVFFSAGTVLSVLVVFFGVFAWWSEAHPPRALTSGATTTSNPSEPVLQLDVDFASLVVGAMLVFCLSAVLRALVTDREIESARLRVGDVTVVNSTVFVEQMRRNQSESHTLSDLETHLRQRSNSLSSRSNQLVERILTTRSLAASASDPPKTPSGVASLMPCRRGGTQQPVHAAQLTSAAVLSATTRALTVPDTVFSRVSERYVLGDERADVTLARTVEGNDSLAALVLLPVLRVRRGSLLGALTLTVDGSASRTLPAVASRGVMVAMLSNTAVEVNRLLGPSGKAEELASLVRRVSDLVVSDFQLKEDERVALLSDLDTATEGHQDKADVRMMRALVDICLLTDVIFAPIPEGCAQTRRVVVEFTSPYRDRVEGWVASTRRFVGIGRDVIGIDLLRVAETNAYHLDVTANEATYIELADVYLPGAHGEALKRIPDDDEDSEYLHVSPLRGDNRAHVYWRDFRVRLDRATQQAGVVPRLELQLRERPPGLLGPAFALSLWIATITWAVGYFYPVLFSSTDVTRSAWSTLILAAPALLTGMLLSRLTSDAVRSMSISTFALVIWLSVNVAAVVTMGALSLSGVDLAPLPVHASITLGQPGWFVLMASTGFHLLSCGLLFLGRGRRYIRTINERWSE